MEIEHVHKILGLPPPSGSSEKLERLLDLPEGTINSLWHCGCKNRKTAAKFLRLARLLNAMEEISDVIKPETRLEFLRNKQDVLGGARPVDLLNNEIEFQELMHSMDVLRQHCGKVYGSYFESRPGVFEYFDK